MATIDRDRFHPLTTSREPNPLRPYYHPPSIGPPTSSSSPTQPAHTARSYPSRPPSASISSTARDLLPELDLDLKTSASEAWQQTRSLLDTLVYRYMSVLLAQPFDVSKTILQVSLPPFAVDSVPLRKRTDPRRQAQANGHEGRGRQYNERYSDDIYDDETDESDEIPDYFSSTAPRSRSPRKRRRTPPSEELSPTPTPRNRRDLDDVPEDYRLHLKRPDSISGVISSLYSTSGAIGLWRGTNTTFLYNALTRTADAFLRSLLLALLGLPEIIGPEQNGLGSAFSVPGSMGLSGLDLSDSPNPLASLAIVALSSGLTGLLFSPLDQVRTRLILTPLTHGPRGLVSNLRRLPSLLPPAVLWLPTTLASALPPLFSASVPLLLRRSFKLNPYTTPSLWSLASFFTTLADLFLRLPLDTLVRRAQAAYLQVVDRDVPLIVAPAPYKGVWGTWWSILFHEGERREKDPRTGMVRVRKGQGVGGLVRGWRVGFWGIVGVWGAGALGGAEVGSGGPSGGAGGARGGEF